MSSEPYCSVRIGQRTGRVGKELQNNAASVWNGGWSGQRMHIVDTELALLYRVMLLAVPVDRGCSDLAGIHGIGHHRY
eukprot:713590-Amphidinium_carterae.1